MPDIGLIDRAVCYPFIPPEQFMVSGVTAPETPAVIKNIRDARIEYELPAYQPSVIASKALAMAFILSAIRVDSSGVYADFKVYMPYYGISAGATIDTQVSVPIIAGEASYDQGSYVRVNEMPSQGVSFTTPSNLRVRSSTAFYMLHPDCIFLYQDAPAIVAVKTSYGMRRSNGSVLNEYMKGSPFSAATCLTVKEGRNVNVKASSSGFSITSVGRGDYDSVQDYPYYTDVWNLTLDRYVRHVPKLADTSGLVSINGHSGAVSMEATASVDLGISQAVDPLSRMTTISVNIKKG